MANSYSQLYVQLVFAVKYRQSLIAPEIRERVEKYICGIVNNINCRPIAVYCNPDHTHLLISIKPIVCVADAVRDIKSFSSRFINEEKLINGHFEWQTGYGAFSYGQSQIETVKRYIYRQPEHHKQNSFQSEYLALLKAFQIDFADEYLFELVDKE